MKSIFKIAAASLGLAVIAAVSTPAMAHPARVEFSIGDADYQPQEYVQPELVYQAPEPVYRYREDDGWRRQQWREHAWRQHEWRERERREHYWRERNQWREEHERRERREHAWRDEHRGNDYDD